MILTHESIGERDLGTRVSDGGEIAPEFCGIHPDVLLDSSILVAEGYKVQIDSTIDRFALSASDQQMVDNEIAELETATTEALAETGVNPELLPLGRDAFTNWKKLTKRAIALKNIYEPSTDTLGEGIDKNIYDRALFVAHDPDGNPYHFSARDIVSLQKGVEKSEMIVSQYREFIDTPIDENSRRIWVGARDGAGVRTRATCAMQEVTEHLSETRKNGEPIITASLACGAASPVFELMKNLKAEGITVEKAILADMDPMALASAYSLAEREGVSGEVSLKLENLVDMETLGARDLTEFIEPNSVDVVDLLGLFEYFPQPLAVSLLKEVKKIMKPGGIIVFGNMLDKRPQQTFFSDVSLWPSLEQRSLRELFEIMDESGLEPKTNAKIILPPQGVYSVVSIKIPKE